MPLHLDTLEKLPGCRLQIVNLQLAYLKLRGGSCLKADQVSDVEEMIILEEVMEEETPVKDDVEKPESDLEDRPRQTLFSLSQGLILDFDQASC